MNLPLAMMGLGIAAWGVPCGQQLETRLRRAVQGHEVSCLGRMLGSAHQRLSAQPLRATFTKRNH